MWISLCTDTISCGSFVVSADQRKAIIDQVGSVNKAGFAWFLLFTDRFWSWKIIYLYTEWSRWG